VLVAAITAVPVAFEPGYGVGDPAVWQGYIITLPLSAGVLAAWQVDIISLPLAAGVLVGRRPGTKDPPGTRLGEKPRAGRQVRCFNSGEEHRD
jgi:hypothetical protein